MSSETELDDLTGECDAFKSVLETLRDDCLSQKLQIEQVDKSARHVRNNVQDILVIFR